MNLLDSGVDVYFVLPLKLGPHAPELHNEQIKG